MIPQKQMLLWMIIGSFFLTTKAYTQSYQSAAGLRLGGLTSGIAIKHFISKTSALEGIVSVARKSFIITGLYEKHVSVDHSNAFKLYFGAGGHLGFFQEGGSYYYNDHRLYTNATVKGIDMIIGMEYKFNNVPINIGFDFKPFIDFFNGNALYFDGGLSIRYTF